MELSIVPFILFSLTLSYYSTVFSIGVYYSGAFLVL